MIGIKTLFAASTLVLLPFAMTPLPWPQPARAQEAGFPEQPGCMRQNASRLPAPECGIQTGDELSIKQEVEHATTLTTPALTTSQCQATVSMEYYQRNTEVRVNGKVENKDCAASSGSFIITARIRDAERNVTRLTFPQTWQRHNDQAVTFTADYPVGSNVNLLQVRTQDIRCQCAMQSSQTSE